MRSHGGVETTLEDKTFLFWKPISFKSHETRMLSGGICFGLRSKDDLQRVDFYSHLTITYQRTEDEPFLMLVHLPGILFQNICGHLI